MYCRLPNMTGRSARWPKIFMMQNSYPFYDWNETPQYMGLGMMSRAISHAKEGGMKYIYLGSLQTPADTYKLQFEGLEWFDGKTWQNDLEKAKKLLKNTVPTSPLT